MVKIMIDPGHGGGDPGAIGNGLQEKDLTLKISLKIRDILYQYEDVRVNLTRTQDVSLSLKQRTDLANAWGADYLMSIHINAGGGNGFESFIYPGSSGVTVANQNVIHGKIMEHLQDVRDRGRKSANFHMVRASKMPAILTENLFIDNKSDAAKLKDDAFLDKIALGHVNGLVAAYGLKLKPSIRAASLKSYFITGGYSGQALQDVHTFLYETGFWYIPTRIDSGAITFKIGAFTEGSENYNKMKDFLDRTNAYYVIRND